MDQFKICQDILEKSKNGANVNTMGASDLNSYEIDFISNLNILEFRKKYIKFTFNVKKETPCKIIYSSISNYFGLINYISAFGNRNVNKVNYNINGFFDIKSFKVGELLIVSCEIEKVTNSLIFQRVIFERPLNSKLNINNNNNNININNNNNNNNINTNQIQNEIIATCQIIFKKTLIPNNFSALKEKKIEKGEFLSKYISKSSKL